VYIRAAMGTIGTTPLRLLFVTSGLERGGAEGFLVRLAVRLAERGHTCGVASLGLDGPLAQPLALAGIDVAPLGAGVVSPSFRLARFARRYRPDVVQGWMYRGNLAALLAGSLSGERPPVVWSVRQGLNDLASGPRLTRLSVSVGARLSHRPFAIVYNAESAKRQHQSFGFAAARAHVIPNGIDVGTTPHPTGARAELRRRLGLEDSALVVALLARWHPVKNHRGFAAAAGLFARLRPEARFLMAGAGIDAENATLATWLREEGIADRVVLLGERSDVPDLLAAADLATLASHGEALPNALIEAMAAGCPCVAPDVGDIAALIGETGVVVRADDADALSAGWEKLAAMPAADRHALGDKARMRVAVHYRLDDAVSAFEALYVEAARG
jgi:glycosyltransferase involved in cell wall biosynthesis